LGQAQFKNFQNHTLHFKRRQSESPPDPGRTVAMLSRNPLLTFQTPNDADGSFAATPQIHEDVH
jgi:hypothetical protein